MVRRDRNHPCVILWSIGNEIDFANDPFDLNSPATGKDGVRDAYRGRGLAIVQSGQEPGKVRLTARAAGLKEGSVEIEPQP
jgi:hypothetical protein